MTRRILFLDQYGDVGGGQTVLLSLLDAADGFDAVAVLAPRGALEQAVRERSGGAVAYIPCAQPRLSQGRKRLGDAFRLLGSIIALAWHLPLLRQQDVIYVNGLRHLPAMLLLAPLLKAKIIYHVHLDHSAVEKRLIRLAAGQRVTHAVVSNSSFVQKRLQTPKSLLIENALDSRFAYLPFRDRFTQPLSRAAVCGTVRPEKGQDVAAAAIASHPDITLYIIGRDGDGAEGWIRALRMGAPANLIFDGGARNLAGRLDELGIQLNVVPSQWDEPFGLAAIEGMACSCLTIVSGKGGLSDIAARTGALVAADAVALSAILAELRVEPPLALAARARAQHDAAQAAYAPARFEAEIRTLLEAAFAAARAPL
jgi:glycosyltransferase involved in cell wall biosynthesis